MSYNITCSFFNLLFNWKKTALPCCAGFCYITTQISCNSRSSEHQAWHPVLYSNSSTSIYFEHDSVYISTLLFPFVPLSPFNCVHKCVLYVCTSISSLQTGSSIHIYALMSLVFKNYCLIGKNSTSGTPPLPTNQNQHHQLRDK